MREPENCKLVYCGFASPQSPKEVDFEILGLEVLIRKAEERIANLKQTRYLADIAITNNCDNLKDFFTE